MHNTQICIFLPLFFPFLSNGIGGPAARGGAAGRKNAQNCGVRARKNDEIRSGICYNIQ